MDVHHYRELNDKAKNLNQQAERNKLVGPKAPHINYDILVHPPLAATQTSFPRQTSASKLQQQQQQHNAARKFGYDQLYGNSFTKQQNMLN